MYTFIVFVITIGILIFVHEFGHFIAARLGKIKVLRFSLGFGPKLVGKKVGDTEYQISALPFGGYVKMAGESPQEEATGAPDEFASKSVSTRAFVVLSGPLMNILLAFIIMPLVFMIGIKTPAYLEKSPVVGWVDRGSPAEKAGIRTGDYIIEVEGQKIENWNSLVVILSTHPSLGIKLKVKRDGTVKEIFLPRASKNIKAQGYAGIYPPISPRIGQVRKGYPAEKAGFKPGDLIVAVDNISMHSWHQVSAYIRSHVGKDVDVAVKRGDKILHLQVRPVMDKELGYGVIGIVNRPEVIVKKYGLIDSIKAGMSRMVGLTYLTFDIIKRLFTMNLSIKALGGPIMIAKLTGEAAHSGMADLMAFLAFMSLQLGVLNLLPIPVLDGGWLLFLLIEKIKGSPISRKTMEVAQTIGFALLITLMIIVSYNDILRVFR